MLKYYIFFLCLFFLFIVVTYITDGILSLYGVLLFALASLLMALKFYFMEKEP